MAEAARFGNPAWTTRPGPASSGAGDAAAPRLTPLPPSRIQRGFNRSAFKEHPMSRRCELTGKRRQIGHLVSHSNVKTKREFQPNLVDVTLASDALGRAFRLRISAHALRSVDHIGGLDAFLIKAGEDTLSERAVAIRRELKKKLAAPAA